MATQPDPQTTGQMSAETSGLKPVEISEPTRRDVSSPATNALLGFLVHFAEQKKEYEDVIKKVDGKSLWLTGLEESSRPEISGPSARQAGKSYSQTEGVDFSLSDDRIPDESAQDQESLLNIVNGPGLQPVPKSLSVTIVGAGVSGLVAGYELKRAGFDVRILEASSRVGGRIRTFRDPTFAPGLHGEGGAMRIPGDHFLLRAYIQNFNIGNLFPFEMKNKFIYLSGYKGGTTMTYDDFNFKLRKKDEELLSLFPGLDGDKEKGKTCDDLFFEAVKPVVKLFKQYYDQGGDESTKIRRAYQMVTETYDKYSLRTYLEEVAKWTPDAIRLYDLGNAHVVLENGFIESWKDAFLSSNNGGEEAQMEQLQGGMDQVPKAFISPDRAEQSLADNITYGARVTNISVSGDVHPKTHVKYETSADTNRTVTSDFLILAIPYTAQRAITQSKPFKPSLEQAIRDVRYVEVTKVLLQYKTRWWEGQFRYYKQGTDGGLVSDLPVRYTMFPKSAGNEQFGHTKRGVVMAAYTFEQDATILGAMSQERQIRVAAENLDRMFPDAKSLELLEAGASQVFPSDELAGGSAFCYFGPKQKTKYLETMCKPDWAFPPDSENYRVFFAGEHASYTHGWIHGAMEAGLRAARQVHTVVTTYPQELD
ncbi:hypothetical protein TWF694_002355 [Orbilia ellipsospora]|uniref:Amine oxidase domain-containing protein n=1 Tax=Orbilia ellipsospora TaxID=2528407 RepID=A0AAV9X2U2_9PEZI